MRNTSSALLFRLPLAAGSVLGGCSSTAVEHGAVLVQDPRVTGSDASPYSCSTCHEGIAGERGDEILTGVPLAGVVERPSYWGGQELELLRSINACLYYFMFENKPWTADDEEARAIYAWLESLTPRGDTRPAPFPVVYEVYDVERGETQAGEDIYRRACQSCHGATSTGDGATVEWAPLLPEDFLDEHPDAEYTAQERRLVMIEKVRHGAFVGYSGQMPPFSQEVLSDDDLGNLLEYLGLTGPDEQSL